MIDLEGALRCQWELFFTLHREDGLTTAELDNGPAHLDVFGWDENQEREDEYQSSEEDYFMEFNSKKRTTTVTFCHASIGDFFRDESEGKVSARGNRFGVIVNYYEAKAHMLKTYLRLITDTDFARKVNDSGNMLGHAAWNWCSLLLTSFSSKISPESRREIAKMLLIAFRSEESMQR